MSDAAWPPGPVWVVLPTYNERENVVPMLEALLAEFDRHGWDGRVLVVDDGSPDGTAALADEVGRRDPRASVLRRAAKQGIGPAYRAGFRAALAGGAALVVEMDCDFSHDPRDVARLVAASRDADLVLGSRFLAGRPGYRVPVSRRAGMAACRWMAARVGDLSLTDPTSGFRGLRRPVAERLAREGFPGGLTETSLLIHLHRDGVRLAEVPVRMLPPSGRSMHRGLAGGAHFLRISWAVLALARGTVPPPGDEA